MSDHLPHHLCRAVPWLPREKKLRLSIKLPQLTTGIAKSPIDVFTANRASQKLTWAPSPRVVNLVVPNDTG